MTLTTPYDQAPDPWRKRHPQLFHAAIGVGAALVLFGVIVFVFTVIIGKTKSSDAYAGALARVRSSPAVVSALGSPLKEGWFVTGNIHVSGPTGLAELTIPISGPKGKARIHVGATKHLGEWRFDQLIVELESTQERIDLVPILDPKDTEAAQRARKIDR